MSEQHVEQQQPEQVVPEEHIEEQEQESETQAVRFYLKPGTYTVSETTEMTDTKMVDPRAQSYLTSYRFTVNKNGTIAQAEKVSNIVVVRNYAYRHYSEKCPPKWK